MVIETSMALAVLLSQAASDPVSQPEERLSDHVIINIKRSLSTATAAAAVTVTGFDEKTAQLHVDEAVVGTIAEDLKVPAKAFSKRDLQPGTQLLVFFRGKEGAPAPTGQYELISDGKIREYTKDLYLNWTKYEQTKLPKPKAQAKPAAPAPTRTTGPVSAAAPVRPPQG
jgi:hypothetical protein